jgi:hypothetical protein
MSPVFGSFPMTVTQPRDVLLRRVSTFDPDRSAIATDWAALADLAEENGLAPLVSYNLEYRLGGAGAPQETRDRLMALYQGTLNDNVFKLVTLKRVLSEVDVSVMLMDATAVADCAYPHVAFRPVPEIRLGTKSQEYAKLGQALARGGFKPDPNIAGVFSDNRTRLVVASQLAPVASADTGIWERSLGADAYGSVVRRPGLEDSILLAVLSMSRESFAVPLIQFVDLRELVKGAPATGVVYAAPPDPGKLQTRAAEWGLLRALYAAMAVSASLFPEEASNFSKLTPPLGFAARSLVDRLVVSAVLARAGSQAAEPISGFGRALLDN